MFVHERYQHILTRLNELGSVRTIELAAALGVTHETIRNDLLALELRGELVRIHGGATRPSRARGDVPLTERQLTHREAKMAIAREAVKRIQPNETIFLDASSTALTITEFLPDFPLTLLTNALNVFTALEGRQNIDLICTGGLYDSRSRSFIGLLAETTLHRYNIHRMFFSGSGLDLQRGVSETNSRQALFKERVIALSEDVIFLADHTKLGHNAAFFFAKTADLTTLITDHQADEVLTKQLIDQGINVVVAAD